MVLYVAVTTDIKDLLIDYIEVQLKSGQTVSLNWDESEIVRTDNGFSAKYIGVCFGEDYANGRIKELEDLRIMEAGLYSESTEEKYIFSLDEMEFCEEENSLFFSDVYSKNSMNI